MKITIVKTVDKRTQKEVGSDSDFPQGQTFLVKDEVGQLLVDKGFAVKVEPKK